jgi:hypothetical protein
METPGGSSWSVKFSSMTSGPALSRKFINIPAVTVHWIQGLMHTRKVLYLDFTLALQLSLILLLLGKHWAIHLLNYIPRPVLAFFQNRVVTFPWAEGHTCCTGPLLRLNRMIHIKHLSQVLPYTQGMVAIIIFFSVLECRADWLPTLQTQVSDVGFSEAQDLQTRVQEVDPLAYTIMPSQQRLVSSYFFFERN